MQIFSVRDNEYNRWKRNARKKSKKTKHKRTRGTKAIGERVRTKLFCGAFKLGLLQFICKDSLIFKVNWELALSIILKERELCESKPVAVGCRCLKILDL